MSGTYRVYIVVDVKAPDEDAPACRQVISDTFGRHVLDQRVQKNPLGRQQIDSVLNALTFARHVTTMRRLPYAGILFVRVDMFFKKECFPELDINMCNFL